VFKVKFLVAAVLLLGLAGAAASLTGCGFFPPLPSNNTCTTNCTTSVSYMYIGNRAGSAPAIAGLTLTTTTTPASGATPASSTLALSATSGSNYALSFPPTALAITPSNSYLYVGETNGNVGGIYIYAINTDRSITLQTGSPVSTVTYPVAMQVDPTGAYLLVLNFSTATTASVLSIYSIGTTTGALTSVGSFTMPFVGAAQQLAISSSTSVSPQNVVATLGSGGIQALTFDPTSGVLTNVSNTATKGSLNLAQGVTINPANTYAFETETVSNLVRVFSINPTTGALTEVGSGFSTGNGPSAVLVDSSGDYVYVTNKADNTISGYSQLAGTGNLTSLGAAFATGTGPVSLVEDATKTYVGVVSQGAVLTTNTGGNPDIQIYTFDATTLGNLDKAGSANTGTEPTVAGPLVATY